MKIHKLLFPILLSFMFVLSGCSKQNEMTDAIKFKQEYESLNGTIREKDGKKIRTISIDETNPMVYTTDQEILNKIKNKDSFVVYFGFADCPWCRSVLPTLLEVSKTLDISQIYYCDISNIRDTFELDENNQPIQTESGSQAYPELLKSMDSVLKSYALHDEDGNEIQTGEKRIYAPNIVVFINGKAKALTTGTSSLQTDAYMELSEDILQDSYGMILDTLLILTESSACSIEPDC